MSRFLIRTGRSLCVQGRKVVTNAGSAPCVCDDGGGGGGPGCACCELQERCGWNFCVGEASEIRLHASVGLNRYALTPLCGGVGGNLVCRDYSLPPNECSSVDIINAACVQGSECVVNSELLPYPVCNDETILLGNTISSGTQLSMFKQFADLPWNDNPSQLQYTFGHVGPLHGQVLRLLVETRVYGVPPRIDDPVGGAVAIIDFAFDIMQWKAGIAMLLGNNFKSVVSESASVSNIVGTSVACANSFGALFQASGVIEAHQQCQIPYGFVLAVNANFPLGPCDKDGELEPLFPGQATPGLPGA